MTHYLIAGAAGYAGSRLAAQLLEQGHRVRGLVLERDGNVVEELAARGMVVWIGDLTRPESLIGVADGVDVIYNLTSHIVLDGESVRRLYVDGNRHLLAAAQRAGGVRRYIFASNTAVYGHGSEQPLTEDSPASPTFPLGHIMVAAEQTLLETARRLAFPAIILRTGTIYGPGRDIVDLVETGTAALALIGNGRNFTAHIHIDDLLTILEQVAVAGQPGAIYNVCDDLPLRAADLYGEVRRRLGMVPPRTHSPEVALAAGLDPSVVGMAAASVRLSNARMKHDLGIALRYPSVLTWLDERLGVAELELTA